MEWCTSPFWLAAPTFSPRYLSSIMSKPQHGLSNLSPIDNFPDYNDSFEEISPIMSAIPKAVSNIQAADGISRGPTPQPTHFSVPLASVNGNGHRILRSATVGYVAPEFKGKTDQMKQGELTMHIQTQRHRILLTLSSSQGNPPTGWLPS